MPLFFLSCFSSCFCLRITSRMCGASVTLRVTISPLKNSMSS
ncbi:MAG: hypothetical protein V8T10_02925 [Merdibacter sp.]